MKVIELKGDLSELLISQLQDALLNRQNIELRIDSPGGRRELKNEILAEMGKVLESGLAITAIVIGQASSSAFMILQGCTCRKALASAMLMFHPLQVSVPEGVYVMGGETAVNPYDPEYLRFLSDLSVRSGVSEDTLWVWGYEERVFSAQEALRHRFIDEIV